MEYQTLFFINKVSKNKYYINTHFIKYIIIYSEYDITIFYPFLIHNL